MQKHVQMSGICEFHRGVDAVAYYIDPEKRDAVARSLVKEARNPARRAYDMIWHDMW